MKITNFNEDDSFIFESKDCNLFESSIHYHKELEISILQEGNGVCFVGNGIVNQEIGNLYFFGSNIFHHFKCKFSNNKKDCNKGCDLLSLKFKEEILPAKYSQMQEFENINKLFKAGKYGLVWKKEHISDCEFFIHELKNLTGLKRLSKLFYILDLLGKRLNLANKIAEKKISLSDNSKDDVYKKVLSYICLHFQEKFCLSELAESVGMNKTALCRYFKNKIGEPIFSFLLMLRLSYAKKELEYSDISISKVALNSGFNNLSNFNVLFKREEGITPLQYRKQVRLTS